MQPAQRRLGRAEVGDIAIWLGQMQRDTIDEAAHQRAPSGPEQFGPDVEALRARQRLPLAREEMARRPKRPPRHLVEPAQHGVDLAAVATEATALDG